MASVVLFIHLKATRGGSRVRIGGGGCNPYWNTVNPRNSAHPPPTIIYERENYFGVITTFTVKAVLQLFKTLATLLYTMMAKPALEWHCAVIQFLTTYFIAHIRSRKFDFLKIFIQEQYQATKRRCNK